MGSVIGCRLDASDVLPERVEDLTSRFGVTTLFVRGACHLPGLAPKAPAASADGRTPGLWLADDDAPLRAALDAARAAGVDPYLVLTNPLAGAADWADLLAEPTGHDVDAEHPPLCPNQPKLLKWLKAAALEAVKTYKPAGVFLEDFSIGPPAKLDTLFMCWCDRCRARAVDLGYDADRLLLALQGVRSKLAESDLKPFGRMDWGIGQCVEAFGYDTGFLDWLNFRADCVSSCLYEIRQALAGQDTTLRVVVSSKAPTVAMLAGQRRLDFLRDSTLADAYAPAVCGPAAGVLETVAGHAEALGGSFDSESDALAFSAKLHGCSGLPLPASVRELVDSPSPELLIASAERELAIALATPGAVPQRPAIDVQGLPADVVAAVVKRITESVADGLTYLGVPR